MIDSMTLSGNTNARKEVKLNMMINLGDTSQDGCKARREEKYNDRLDDALRQHKRKKRGEVKHDDKLGETCKDRSEGRREEVSNDRLGDGRALRRHRRKEGSEDRYEDRHEDRSGDKRGRRCNYSGHVWKKKAFRIEFVENCDYIFNFGSKNDSKNNNINNNNIKYNNNINNKQ